MPNTATPQAGHPGKELVRRLVDEVVNARDPSALEELADGAVIDVREGVQTWRGEGCCTAPELSLQSESCADDCCGTAAG